MSGLGGARIALLEARLSSELAELVRREGGTPVCAPAVLESNVDVTALIPVLIDDINRERCEIVVFLTGAGLASMFAQAESIGVLPALVSALASVTTVCRGPKPGAALRKHGIPVRVSVGSPYTTAELLAVLPASLVAGKGIALLHDGGGNTPLVEALRSRGAWVEEIRSYEWGLPADVGPVVSLVEDLIDGWVDAVAFTNQVQVRHLFQIGARMNRSAALLYALRNRTVVGSIGPTCSAVLAEYGVPAHVTASPPKMRPLITSVGEFLATRRQQTLAEIST